MKKKVMIPRWYLVSLILYGVLQIILSLQYFFQEEMLRLGAGMLLCISVLWMSITLGWLLYNLVVLTQFLRWRFKVSWLLLPIFCIIDIVLTYSGVVGSWIFKIGPEVMFHPIGVFLQTAIPFVLMAIAIVMLIRR